jgi:hypothetical protein
MTISSGIQRIESGCFAVWIGMAAVTFECDYQVQILGDFAFMLCESLQSICIPSSIEIVAKFCFAEYKHLSTLTFESGCRVPGVEMRNAMALSLPLEPAEQGELALDWPVRCLVRKKSRPVSRSPFGQVPCRRTQTGEFPEQR